MQQPQKVLLKTYKYAYKLKAEGKTIDQVKAELRIRGFDDKSAAIIAENTDKNYTGMKARVRRKNILYGSLGCSGGAAIILTTYFTKLDNSGVPYFVGACGVVFGLYKLIMGLMEIM